jgi:hypothetical protein
MISTTLTATRAKVRSSARSWFVKFRHLRKNWARTCSARNPAFTHRDRAHAVYAEGASMPEHIDQRAYCLAPLERPCGNAGCTATGPRWLRECTRAAPATHQERFRTLLDTRRTPDRCRAGTVRSGSVHARFSSKVLVKRCRTGGRGHSAARNRVRSSTGWVQNCALSVAARPWCFIPSGMSQNLSSTTVGPPLAAVPHSAPVWRIASSQRIWVP